MDGRQGVEVTEEDEVARLEGGNTHGLSHGPQFGRGLRESARRYLLVELHHVARAVGSLTV